MEAMCIMFYNTMMVWVGDSEWIKSDYENGNMFSGVVEEIVSCDTIKWELKYSQFKCPDENI